MNDESYIPAMKYNWLTPVYDLVARLMGDSKLKQRLLELSEIKPGQRVLDVGCGTGTFLAMAKEREPGAELFGIDGDPNILQIAGSKLERKHLNIQLDQGMAYKLPYADGYFDRVVSSLVFHHLTTENKHRSFAEVLRVLRPEGSMVILDFGPPVARFTRFLAGILRRLEHTSDNLEGRLPEFAKQAGFQDIQYLALSNTIFGSVWILRAKRI